MNRIEKFVNSIFSGVELNEDIEAQKEEIILNMTDKYEELVEDGLNEAKAYQEVVGNFGSVDDIKRELGLSEVTRNDKLNVKKVIIVTVTVLVMAVVVIISNYIKTREFIVQDLNKIAYEINMININSKSSIDAYETESIHVQNAVDNLKDLNEVLERELNFVEENLLDETNHQLYISQYITQMHEKLGVRKRLGYWNEMDDEVQERYTQLTYDLLYLVESESFTMRGKDLDDEFVDKNRNISLLTSQLNIDKIANKYYELNELAASYVKYTLLPEDIRITDASDVMEVLDRIYDVDGNYSITTDHEVDVLIHSGHWDDITVNLESVSVDITMEAVNSKVIEIHNFYQAEGQVLNEVYNVEDVEDVVKKIFGDHGEYQVTYLENSRSFSNGSENKYYSYEIIPYYEGYPLYFRYVIPEIHFSGYDFDAFLYFGEQEIPTAGEIGETLMLTNKDEVLVEVVKNQNDYIRRKFGDDADVNSFTYESTGYCYSIATGKYDLMHIFNYCENGQQLLIHAETGVGE